MSGTRRLTVAQALVEFLIAQHVDQGDDTVPYFAGCFGIFGHGNLAGIGQALQQQPKLRYLQARNEQAMVHSAIAYSKHLNRSRAFACTASVGPGSTNMVTGAATATINRIPVLLLPGDVFATRRVDPVLQQLEAPGFGDVSVNDCFRPVSRYWDRITRAEQLPSAMLEAMRVLTDPAETGAVTLCMPQDVQAEAHDWPVGLFEPRVWTRQRQAPSPSDLGHLARQIAAANKPLIIAGGGVHYAEAADELRRLCDLTGIPVAETQAGKGALAYDHDSCVGSIGATGTSAANALAAEADLIIGIGTRYSDFTTASRTAFANPDVRIVNVNANARDAAKLGAVPVVADAREVLRLLADGGDEVLAGLRISDEWRERVRSLRTEWEETVTQLVTPQPDRELPAQAEVIGAVNRAALRAESEGRGATVVCAAGSLPGDLHKLWLTSDPRGYHMEYGYSCMGYEVAGGMGVAIADPDRDVYVMVGDGSWLMMSSEIVTAVQEGIGFTVVLIDNHGFGSIGALSTSLGSDGFGTRYRMRTGHGEPGGSGGFDGEPIPLDLAATARGMGAHVVECSTIPDLETALAETRDIRNRPVVLTIETDPSIGVPGFDSWWDVPVAEVSDMPAVQQARADYERNLERVRPFVNP
jgi:3D-(3,5/4)-trihydroxycyclohexane-1,2-dione acylhydrolase (decyclizing)